MGLFVMDMAKNKTPRTSIETAIANLELYLQQNPDDPDYQYLILLAKTNIDNALEMINEVDK